MDLRSVLLIVFCNFAHAQDCSILNQLRNHARSAFSTIAPKITSHPAKVQSTLLLPNAQSCTVQTYSSDDAKYTCEWALVKERDKEDLALYIYNEFVNDLAVCASSITKIDRHHSNERKVGASARFADSEFRSSNREAFIRINLDYSYHWWTMTMDYSVNDQDE